jgi:mannose-6-phosphate isomerase-like protein (cupin superfamily)
MSTGLFEKHIESIRAKKHWWGRLEDIVGYDWNHMMYMIDTHPSKLYDWNREKNRLGCNEFHRRPSTPTIAKVVHKEMEEFFVDPAPKKDEYVKGPPQITNIAFVGFGQDSGSYPRHKDSMDVFLLQAIGECKITIGYNEEPRNADETVIMKPGDCVYLPRGTWHQLQPTISRVTFSFGFESDPDTDPSFFV